MKKQMNEARGVPAGITNYATKIFNDVLEKLKSNNFQEGFTRFTTVVDAPGKFLKEDKPVQISKINVYINFGFGEVLDVSRKLKKRLPRNPNKS
jgi:hypothetical protein